MRNDSRCPKEVKKAIRAFARAVRLTADLADLPCPDPLTEYYAKEYLDEMEDLLLQQLITATMDCREREGILDACGLDYLAIRLGYLAEEFEEE